MHSETDQSDPTQSQRIELILQQLDALPTLSTIAVRVLELTTDDNSEVDEIVKLISCDVALASKVLKLCRCSKRGRAANVGTLDRAVIMLGFDTVRSAVLSVQVFELFDGIMSPGGELFTRKASFDRNLFWQHSLAVAIVAENLCKCCPQTPPLDAGEAFISGLLHDLGQLCLHLILPKSFDRVCELAVAQNAPLDMVCRQTIGIDSHTVGRRLAEHWQLPNRLCDVLWLHGQPYDSLPDLAHKPMIGLVTLADAIVRQEHIAPLGHGPRNENIELMCEEIGISHEVIENLIPHIREELLSRSENLGLNLEHCSQQLMRSLCQANEVLGRTNVSIRQKLQLAGKQTKTLQAIIDFHDSAAPGGSVMSLLSRVVQSATNIFGEGFYSILYQSQSQQPWQLYQFDGNGHLQHSQIAIPAGDSDRVRNMVDKVQISSEVLELLPPIRELLTETVDLEAIRMLPLRCGWGVNAILLHNCQFDSKSGELLLETLSRTWGAAIAAGAQHEGAKRLGERLVDANRELVEAQDILAQTRTMAAVGELAAGAAHEMNNPLTVISGRSQLLAESIPDPEQRSMARQISSQAHRLSDIITALRLFAEPTRPHRRKTDLSDMITGTLQQAKPRKGKDIQINMSLASELPSHVLADPDQIGRALSELLRNAMESEGSTHIELRVQIERADGRLKIQVTDDGSGLAPHTLAHAFDPFFSAKSAGRQPGLGLAQARRLIEASGGQISLANGLHKGAVATIWLPNWQLTTVESRRNVA